MGLRQLHPAAKLERTALTTYTIVPRVVEVRGMPALRLDLGFGTSAFNTDLVREVEARMLQLKSDGLGGRPLVMVSGPASLPVLAVIVSHVAHLFGAVAIFDPKLDGYIVCVTHDPRFAVGELILASDVAVGASSVEGRGD